MLRLSLYIFAFWTVAFWLLPDGYFYKEIQQIFGVGPEKIFPHDDYDDQSPLNFDDQGRLLKHPSPYFKIFADKNGERPDVNDLIKPPFQTADNSKWAYIPTSVKWKMPEEVETLPYLRYATEDQLGRRSHTHSWIAYDGDSSRLPILSLITEKEGLFDLKNGIYIRGLKSWDPPEKWQQPWWEWPANYKQRGMKWEREASWLLMDRKGETLWEENLGIRIHGNATRAFPQKSLRLTFRKMYGGDEVKNKEQLKGAWPKKISAFVLRNGGNDWDFTLIRDVLQHQVALEMGLLAQDHYSVRVYLNGVYWGIHHLRPRVNKTFLAEMLDVKKKHVSLYKEGKAKYDGNDYPVKDFFKALASDDIWKHLHRDKIFNYLALQIFTANTDWPENNVMWTVDKKGKWFPIVKDMDYGLGYTGPEQFKTNMFKVLEKSRSNIAKVYQHILNNPQDKADFFQNFQELLTTHLHPEQWNKHLDEITQNLSQEIPHHCKRWRKFTPNQWQNNIKAIQQFIQLRHKLLQQEINLPTKKL